MCSEVFLFQGSCGECWGWQHPLPKPHLNAEITPEPFNPVQHQPQDIPKSMEIQAIKTYSNAATKKLLRPGRPPTAKVGWLVAFCSHFGRGAGSVWDVKLLCHGTPERVYGRIATEA
jgi:hypothetical protein